MDSLLIVTPVTGWYTVTLHMEVSPLSTDLQRIVAEPQPTALTIPFSFTVTTDVLLEDHITDLSDASSGKTKAVKRNSSSIFNVIFV